MFFGFSGSAYLLPVSCSFAKLAVSCSPAPLPPLKKKSGRKVELLTPLPAPKPKNKEEKKKEEKPKPEEKEEELDVPEGFPFEILDNPGDNTITLKREFAGENIQIIVYMNPDVEEDEEEDDEDDDTDQENASKPSISLHVTIDKGEEVPILEFVCNLNSDELEIENMTRKNPDDSDGQGTYEGPEFSDLDESLQKALHHYLKVRGISDSLYGFLSEYMMKKDEREYRTWLKNIEEFVHK